MRLDLLSCQPRLFSLPQGNPGTKWHFEVGVQGEAGEPSLKKCLPLQELYESIGYVVEGLQELYESTGYVVERLQ